MPNTRINSATGDPIELSPVKLLIFQGTPFCNIDCKYCYLANRTDRSRMSLETVEAACQRLTEARLIDKRPIVAWHAGEPLVLGTEFYEKAFATIERSLPDANVMHSVQTNAMLIDEAWVRLFKKWKVSVGVSLDGPPHIHDRNRRTRSDKPTSAFVLEGIKRLKDAGMPLHVISVLTRESIEQPRELFLFFKSLGVDRIGFNIDQAEGSNKRSTHNGVDQGRAFRDFLRAYFSLVTEKEPRQDVRELKNGLKSVFQRDITNADQVEPIRILSVGHDGQLGTFSPELFGALHPRLGRLTFGNVHEADAFEKMARHPRLIEAILEIQRGVRACRKGCPYFEVCGGGYPSNKLGEHGTFDAMETLACRFKPQAVTDTVVDMICAGLVEEEADTDTVPN